MSRKIDRLGRIFIPKHLLKVARISYGDYVDVSYRSADNVILIKQAKNKCIICGEKDNLQCISEKKICGTCIDKIKNL